MPKPNSTQKSVLAIAHHQQPFRNCMLELDSIEKVNEKNKHTWKTSRITIQILDFEMTTYNYSMNFLTKLQLELNNDITCMLDFIE